MAVKDTHKHADARQGYIGHTKFSGRHSLFDKRDDTISRADDQAVTYWSDAHRISEKVIAPDRQPNADPSQDGGQEKQNDRYGGKNTDELAPFRVHRLQKGIAHFHWCVAFLLLMVAIYLDRRRTRNTIAGLLNKFRLM